MSTILSLFKKKKRHLRMVVYEDYLYYDGDEIELKMSNYDNLDDLKKQVLELITKYKSNNIVLLMAHSKILKKRTSSPKKKVADFFYSHFKNKITYKVYDVKDLFFSVDYNTPPYILYNNEYFHCFEELVTPIPKVNLNYCTIDSAEKLKQIIFANRMLM